MPIRHLFCKSYFQLVKCLKIFHFSVVTHNSLKKITKTLSGQVFEANTTEKNSHDKNIPERIKTKSLQLCFEESCQRWKTQTRDIFVAHFVHYLNKYQLDHRLNIHILVDKKSGFYFEIISFLNLQINIFCSYFSPYL